MSRHMAEQDFGPDRAASRQARHFVARTLRDHGYAALVDTAEILTSELVTNALLHARSSSTVRITGHGTGVIIEVHDSSPAIPLRKHYGTGSTTGRGLMLVETLAADWGAEQTAAGKRVWVLLDPDQPGTAEGAFAAAAQVAADTGSDDVDLDTLAAILGKADVDEGSGARRTTEVGA